MGSTKEYLMEMEEFRREKWIDEVYPDVEPETDEWEQAAEQYSYWMDDLAEQAERQWFQDSLNDLDDRYRYAVRELHELETLVSSAHTDIVFRLAYVHTVTVMEAFLMYSARALLNDKEHLDRFYTNVASIPKLKGIISKCARAVINNTQKHPEGFPPDEAIQRRRTAQLFVSQQTFHNLGHLKTYFTAVLKTPPEWPVEPLEYIVRTRQDLVHRNGVSEDDVPVSIGSWDLTSAITAVRRFIDVVAHSLRRETGLDESLPVFDRDSL
ncbi:MULTISPECIES: hypothetical protein [Atlantibacter]|uniref:RiboL-PSP-HEPN domain-containing protein n=1 Tax=Atlantibacter subterraneus TaxID=255519 RepID=A0ABU4E5U0_9ENTR|nr:MULTISPECIES: hypothetical protein [Atlantibacter]MDV7024488.1 hypothetical protein [Atlantibacter subterranea]MDW2745051.1 hypothetical protein [Atlantibacter subterranea]MDZ5667585.1 hypothetical protein [Atlantibacter hermannii]QFH72793.1 hypothetical protein FR762_23795 [Enterobacter sp. E76]